MGSKYEKQAETKALYAHRFEDTDFDTNDSTLLVTTNTLSKLDWPRFNRK